MPDLLSLLSYVRQPRTTRISFFFFNDTATTEIYTLSLHDALPIYRVPLAHGGAKGLERPQERLGVRGLDRVARSDRARATRDRKSTRLNSSHVRISYAVFCLKKKKHRTKDSSRMTQYRLQCSGRFA